MIPKAIVGDKNTPPKRASTHSEKLKLYGLYKQATVGSEKPARPGMLNIANRQESFVLLYLSYEIKCSI